MSNESVIKPEIFKQRVPCSDCPFKKDGGVRHTFEMMASYVAYFLTYPGATFPCHKSVPEHDDRSAWSPWQDGQVICAGGLLLAAKLGKLNAIIDYAQAQGWYSQKQHTPEELALVFDSVEDMLSGLPVADNAADYGQSAKTMCLQCSVQAVLDGRDVPVFDESPEMHTLRVHGVIVAHNS